MPTITVTVPDIELEFEVFCSCGNGLCSVTRVSYRRGEPQVVVEPCPKCLEKAGEVAVEWDREHSEKEL